MLTPAEQVEHGRLVAAAKRIRDELLASKTAYMQADAEVERLRAEISQLGKMQQKYFKIWIF